LAKKLGGVEDGSLRWNDQEKTLVEDSREGSLRVITLGKKEGKGLMNSGRPRKYTTRSGRGNAHCRGGGTISLFRGGRGNRRMQTAHGRGKRRLSFSEVGRGNRGGAVLLKTGSHTRVRGRKALETDKRNPQKKTVIIDSTLYSPIRGKNNKKEEKIRGKGGKGSEVRRRRDR